MSAGVVGLWGSDLWDRYDGVIAHVNRGTEELGGGWVAEIYIAMHSQRSHSNKLFRYAKYVRERGEVEREYARALRKLVARWDNLFVCWWRSFWIGWWWCPMLCLCCCLPKMYTGESDYFVKERDGRWKVGSQKIVVVMITQFGDWSLGAVSKKERSVNDL